MTYTVSCFLCRASYRSRDQLEDHLTYQHGVVFNVDFVTRISQYRTLNDKLPTITLPKTYNNNSRKECSKCVKSSNATNKKKPPPGPQLDKIKSEAKESSDLNEKEKENVDLKKVTLEESVTPQKSGENSFSSIKVKPQNIRDKTNTYCNVCDLKLDSRILFLSHCSTVHDVKFKVGISFLSAIKGWLEINVYVCYSGSSGVREGLKKKENLKFSRFGQTHPPIPSNGQNQKKI